MDSLAHRDFVFDTGTLLEPISDAQPSGESLRYDPLYDQIREARREDDPIQERGVWKLALKKADWSNVENLCLDALKRRTKDLQVAAWLLEAWMRLYGLPGLREGARVLNALSNHFWDTIHPLPDEGDIEYRIAPFEWANEKLPIILKLIPITNPGEDHGSPYTLADWENAVRPRKTGRDEEEPPVTQESFNKSLADTPTHDLAALLEMTDGADLALSQLIATLDEKCGGRSPGLGQLSTTLGAIRNLLATNYNDRPKPVSERVTHSGSGESFEFQDDSGEDSGYGGPIRSRDQAYQRLSEAADYLARTEPHSPVPYLVKRAIGWGNMKLEDLLPQLVRNSSELSEIYRLLQIGNTED